MGNEALASIDSSEKRNEGSQRPRPCDRPRKEKKLSIQEFFSLAQKAMNESKGKGEVNLSRARQHIERTF